MIFCSLQRLRLLFCEFDNLAVGDVVSVDCEPDKSAHFVPSLLACRAGIYVQQGEFFVVDYFKDVRVTVDHKADVVFGKQAFHAGPPFAGIPADVSEEHAYAFAVEYEEFVAETSHRAGVDIAAHGSDGANFRQTADDVIVADVAGMPYFIAVGEMEGITVVPPRVCVA